MTFFSRCELPQRHDSAIRSATAHRIRTHADGTGVLSALAGFAEDIGILFRYAAGLDYYGRDRVQPHR